MAQKFDPIITWQAPEFRHYPKNIAWFITFFVVVGLLVAYQIVQQDWFGAISFGLLGIIVGFLARRQPKPITVIISDKGVHLEDEHIPYTQIKQFWIVHDDTHKTLNLETTAYLNHQLAIELEDQDPELIREVLLELLPEHEEPHATVAQRIAHRIKF